MAANRTVMILAVGAVLIAGFYFFNNWYFS